FAGWRSVQLLPSQVHVSGVWNRGPPMPNNRRFPLVGSSVSSGLLNRAGPVAGCSSVQVAPFQLQVSFRVGSAFAAPPPKRMTFPEEASKARAPKLRPGGETAGLSWLQ